jgi:AraC family ethanolamine operon transcriptional activator
LEILEEPLRLPLKVLDLCETIGVSAPTLYRAFMQEFGVSPKRYIQIRSLSGVRKHLLEAESGTLVGDVANRWGYWHMGQFAADYRRQFGELPSGTLGGKPSHR